MDVSVTFCDWCCAEAQLRQVWITDPTNPLHPSDGNGHELWVCSTCRAALMRLSLTDLLARHELYVGITTVERRAP